MSPHCAAVSFCGPVWQPDAADWLVAHWAGRPDATEPPANTSGYAASRSAVIPPPADRPVTYTRRASEPYCCLAYSTICTIEAASPLPLVSSAGSNQPKQDRALLADVVCGKTTAKPHRSAYFGQPEWV